jgi:manganese/iron transport system substrate-binding protein
MSSRAVRASVVPNQRMHFIRKQASPRNRGFSRRLLCSQRTLARNDICFSGAPVAKQSPRIYVLALLALLILAGCGQKSPVLPALAPAANAGLRAVATTTIVADVVRNVAGDQIDVQVLVPPGVDEHNFQPTPADVTRVADADVVFMSGAGLETFVQKLVENAGGHARLVSVSDGIDLLQASSVVEPGAQSGQGSDPHVWLDPLRVQTWTDNIAAALSELDPQQAATYQANAAAYRQKLAELDDWIGQQVAQVAPQNRLLVTDHEIFTYFADRYGFEQVGAIIPSYSTTAEPSAQELAALEDGIRRLGVKAVFVGNTVNPTLANRVAADTNIRLVQILTGSLTDGAPAATYLDYMRFNVGAIVQALK